MGTSKAYLASIKGQPQWGHLSGSVTSNCGTGVVPGTNLSTILSNYVGVIGGASVAGRGGSKIGGRAGINTAKRIGGFLGAFSGSGSDIRKALETTGLTGLDGKPLSEVINRLIEYFTGAASTLDDISAKTAAQKLLEELAANAESIEEFRDNLEETLAKESLEDILTRYFGYYIFEHLSIMFYEKLIVDKGKTECDNLFRQIRDFIFEKLKLMNKKNPVQSIDWGSETGDRIIKNIQEDVLKVFEGHEG